MAGILLGFATPALAQAPAANDSLVVGATVKDTAGAVVGTIDAVEANGIIVNTGRNQVAIPRASFGKTADGPLLAATKAELDAAADAAAASERQMVAALLVNGTPVMGAEGNQIGTVDIVENDMVVIKTEAGEAQVPAASFMRKDGQLAIGMTAEAFAAAVEAAKSGS
jgi:preprotein translocase subunit YajC